jgi:hypothetical protein
MIEGRRELARDFRRGSRHIDAEEQGCRSDTTPRARSLIRS